MNVTYRLMAHDQRSPSKFVVPDKSGTRMHSRLAKFLVRDSGTSNLDGDLGSCAYLLASLTGALPNSVIRAKFRAIKKVSGSQSATAVDKIQVLCSQ